MEIECNVSEARRLERDGKRDLRAADFVQQRVEPLKLGFGSRAFLVIRVNGGYYTIMFLDPLDPVVPVLEHDLLSA